VKIARTQTKSRLIVWKGSWVKWQPVLKLLERRPQSSIDSFPAAKSIRPRRDILFRWYQSKNQNGCQQWTYKLKFLIYMQRLTGCRGFSYIWFYEYAEINLITNFVKPFSITPNNWTINKAIGISHIINKLLSQKS